MSGFSPSLPLRRDEQNGFALTQSTMEVIRQNFKNLILTNPGERVMMPTFGVGIRRFLFEPNNVNTHGNISSAVDEQVGQYMPFIEINELDFHVDEVIAPNALNLTIFYTVVPLEVSDAVQLKIEA